MSEAAWLILSRMYGTEARLRRDFYPTLRESLYAVSAELAQRIEREMLSTGRHQGEGGESSSMTGGN